MERRLIVMRHAKSSHDDYSLADHQRPLTPRGQREAREIGERLVALDRVPELVISSDAVRTEETLAELSEVWGEEVEVVWREDFYLAGTQAIAGALEGLEEDVSSVLVLGHNPGWESAVVYFTGEQHTLTTANAVLMVGEGKDWSELMARKTFRIESILRPRKN